MYFCSHPTPGVIEADGYEGGCRGAEEVEEPRADTKAAAGDYL